MTRETVTRLSVVPGGRPRCQVTAVCGAQGLLPGGSGSWGKLRSRAAAGAPSAQLLWAGTRALDLQRQAGTRGTPVGTANTLRRVDRELRRGWASALWES